MFGGGAPAWNGGCKGACGGGKFIGGIKFGGSTTTGGGGGGGGGATKFWLKNSLNDGMFCANMCGSFIAGGGPIFIEFVENAESKLNEQSEITNEWYMKCTQLAVGMRFYSLLCAIGLF